ncbi:Uncharacterised protein [Enterobacter cloacae]|nr:Uncharacterised protein [Enterobacter cloacae]
MSGELAGTVLCVRVTSGGSLLRAYAMNYSVNDGEGYSLGASSSTQQLMVVRRVATLQGDGTGIVYKAAEETATPPSPLLQQALRDQIEAVAREAAAP